MQGFSPLADSLLPPLKLFLEGSVKNRKITATERLYLQWRKTRSEEAKQEYFLQLAAICVKACHTAKLAPPYEREEIDGRRLITGGPLALFKWVNEWLILEIGRKRTSEDRARYLGRRCVFALIDEIRADGRRKRGVPERTRKSWIDVEDVERMRDCMLEAFAGARLPERLPFAKDRELFSRLMDAYPRQLSNAAIAREQGVTEGAIRKRRKRITEACSSLKDGDHNLQVALRYLRLTERYEKLA